MSCSLSQDLPTMCFPPNLPPHRVPLCVPTQSKPAQANSIMSRSGESLRCSNILSFKPVMSSILIRTHAHWQEGQTRIDPYGQFSYVVGLIRVVGRIKCK